MQTDMFADTSAPYVRGSDTSKEAAEKIYDVTGRRRREVFDLLRSNPRGLTDNDMQDILQMNPSTQRPRRIELVKQGLVVDSGARVFTCSGRRATVWVLK